MMRLTRAWLPLNGLRAFETTARHLSFTRAADELCVTQSAVSRQVQRLEDLIGARLIERRARDLALTPIGERLRDAATESFDALAAALADVAAGERRDVLRVGMASAFAHGFGARLVSGFMRRHPEIDLEVESEWPASALEGSGYDVAIAYAAPRRTGGVMDLLWEERVTPLCSALLSAGAKDAAPADFVASRALSHIRTEGGAHHAWECWARAAQIPPQSVRRGAVFNTATLGVRCALEGEGVVATDPRIYSAEIASGRLVAPYATSAATGFGYYLVTSADDLADERLQLFRSWVIAFFSDLEA